MIMTRHHKPLALDLYKLPEPDCFDLADAQLIRRTNSYIKTMSPTWAKEIKEPSGLEKIVLGIIEEFYFDVHLNRRTSTTVKSQTLEQYIEQYKRETSELDNSNQQP